MQDKTQRHFLNVLSFVQGSPEDLYRLEDKTFHLHLSIKYKAKDRTWIKTTPIFTMFYVMNKTYNMLLYELKRCHEVDFISRAVSSSDHANILL